MDFSDSTKILFDRIRGLEPENYIKIIGFLLLQDNSEREMIRLAFSPDNTIQSLINKAKTRLRLSLNSRIEKRPDVTRFTAIGPRANRRLSVGVCQYFIKGFCKHGSQCRFIHSHTMNGHVDGEEDDNSSTGSVEKLEREITGMLNLRGGFPISIAALPMLYYENYGKTLTAEGYLTESQRHGKAGYSLTRLLARLNGIRIIDRPHGQHAVILAEDFPKYMEYYTGDINEHGGIVPSSRQIYLTFPAESNFSEQDVSNYFSKFGIVQDVRIPCQKKRMFGFMTFASAETVRNILAKGNPHFVCGSRILVKPYREKSILVDRHMNYYADQFQHPMYNDASHFLDAETDIHPMPRVIENSRLTRRKLLEEDEQMIEFESMRISNLNLAENSPTNNSLFSYKTDDFIPSLQAQAGRLDFESNDQFNYLPDTAFEIAGKSNTKYNEQQSGQAVNSPFASAIGSGISTAI